MSQFDPRAPRLLTLAAALCLTLTLILSSAAPARAEIDASSTPTVIPFTLSHRQLGYDQPLRLSGRVPSGLTAPAVAVLYRPNGGSWRTVAQAVPKADGRFAVVLTSVRRSGRLRVVPSGAELRAAGEPTVAPVPGGAPALRVFVAARLSAATRRVDVQLGREAVVSGLLRPGRAGRLVTLQVRGRAGWHTVDRERTGAGGAYTLRFASRRPASRPARVRFAGDGVNLPAAQDLGRLSFYRAGLASWYGPGFYGRPLGCGGRMSDRVLGVANKALPCGTGVTLRYGGRTLRVRVIDRGPYVGAREFDLTSATARRLGFVGVGHVQVSF